MSSCIGMRIVAKSVSLALALSSMHSDMWSRPEGLAGTRIAVLTANRASMTQWAAQMPIAFPE